MFCSYGELLVGKVCEFLGCGCVSLVSDFVFIDFVVEGCVIDVK